MVELSTREHALNLVAKNPEWNVLDLGCGIDGIKAAHVYADVENYTNNYPEKRFVQTSGSKTPFKDKEFDFVFSLHIAEHVLDPFKFCEELTRIGKRGFIEVPTPFFDNLVNFSPDNLTRQLTRIPKSSLVEPNRIDINKPLNGSSWEKLYTSDHNPLTIDSPS